MGHTVHTNRSQHHALTAIMTTHCWSTR